jgi:exodeoxyribonuclease-5
MLTEVHRQAQDDPIVRLSMQVRNGERLPLGEYGLTQVVRRADFDPQRALETDQILVGRNVTRRAFNGRIRERRGFDDPLPITGDKLVCLRNNRRKGCSTAGFGTLPRSRRPGADPAAAPEGGRRVSRQGSEGLGSPECFTGQLEELDWQAAQEARRVRLRLRADRAQGAGLAMGRRRAVRRVLSRSPRAARAGSTPASRGRRSG